MNTFKTRVEYEITDASVKTYSFPFPYLRKEFIKVSILHKDNTITALTYGVDYSVDDLSITLVTAPSVSEHLIIYRETTTDRIITWNDGSILLAKDMNTEDAQMLHLQEEQQDYITANALATAVTSDKETIWSALNKRITDVFDPKEEQDAVTKHYMETVQGGFVSQNTALVEQATTQATNAKNSASSAATSEKKANSYSDLSHKWADSDESPDKLEDASSDTGYTKSSKKWAEVSKQYVDIANKWAESTESPDGLTDSDSDTGKTKSAKEWALTSKKNSLPVSQAINNVITQTKEYTDKEMIKSHNVVKPNTTYVQGAVVAPPDKNMSTHLIVTQSGTTSNDVGNLSPLSAYSFVPYLNTDTEPDTTEERTNGTAKFLCCNFTTYEIALKEIIDRVFYKTTDIIQGYISTAGFITNDGKYLNFCIPYAKLFKENVVNLQATSLKLKVRKDGSYIFGSASDMSEVVLKDTSISSVITTLTPMFIQVQCSFNKSLAQTNNAVGIEAIFTFSQILD